MRHRQLLRHLVWLWRIVLHWLGRLVARPRWKRIQTSVPMRRYRAHPKPEWVRKEIIRLKALIPQAGCRTIAHLFNRRFAVSKHMTVGKTYVADTVRRHQYAILLARRKLKHAVPRPVPRNLTWGMDLMVKTDTQGRQHLVLAILDHASRACLRLQRLRDKSALTLLRHVIKTCRQYNTPGGLRTDNEAIFTSQRFRVALRLLGIRPQRTDPGCPWQNGRVERFIGTVKGMLSQGPVGNADQLDHALRYVRTCYNHLRPHQHLQGRTPAEVWAGVDVFASTHRVASWMRVRNSVWPGPSLWMRRGAD